VFLKPPQTNGGKTTCDDERKVMSDSIQHIVVLMLENRPFDHFFGALPNVDGVDPNKRGRKYTSQVRGD
jgi:phospholipase C